MPEVDTFQSLLHPSRTRNQEILINIEIISYFQVTLDKKCQKIVRDQKFQQLNPQENKLFKGPLLTQYLQSTNCSHHIVLFLQLNSLHLPRTRLLPCHRLSLLLSPNPSKLNNLFATALVVTELF